MTSPRQPPRPDRHDQAVRGVEYDSFHFLRRGFDPGTGRVELDYRLGDDLILRESLQLPPAIFEAPPEAIAAALDLLHWTAGVSYWKVACPSRIYFHTHQPDVWQADYLRRLYRHGLAEFAHENQLELAHIINFQGAARTAASAKSFRLPRRALAPIGGGKDSLVAIEQLRQQDIAISMAVVGQSPLIREVAAATRLPLLAVKRQLAPQLKALNAAGALNGHVPITAINSAILLVVALTQGYRWIAFANERSADSATRVAGNGIGVNHQYSKSFAFESDLRAYIQRYIGGVEYFSLLRPWREVAICREFANYACYHSVFSSCNRHFHLDGARINQRWCGQCPKCHFVFLALAPFMEKAAMTAIFGADLLDDPDHEAAFAALLGLDGERPFECIGEIAECRAALADLALRQPWRDTFVVSRLAPRLPADTPALADLLAPIGPHHIPCDLLPGHLIEDACTDAANNET